MFDAVQAAGNIQLSFRMCLLILCHFRPIKCMVPRDRRTVCQAQTKGKAGGSKSMVADSSMVCVQVHYQLIKLWVWGRPFTLAKLKMSEEIKRITNLKRHFLARLNNVVIHGDPLRTVPHIINLRFGAVSSADFF